MFIHHATREIYAVGKENHQPKVYNFDHFIDDDGFYFPLSPLSNVGSNRVPLNGIMDLLIGNHVDLIMIDPLLTTSEFIVNMDSKI